MARRFERAGRRLDLELDRVIRVLDKKVRPAAKRRSVQLLTAAARKLDSLAKSLGASGSGRASRRRKKASR
ncbi:MAG: hypothetical protein ACRD4D_01515 [Candidatus Acidiferrales bacterium]